MLAALFLLLGLSVVGGGGDAQLLCFSASWCGPCQKMKPIVEQLSRDGFPIEKVDVDEHKDLARQFQVNSVPSFVLVNRRGQVIDRIDKATSYKTLTRMLAHYRVTPQQQATQEMTVRGQTPIAVPVVRPVDRPNGENFAPIANAGSRPAYDSSQSRERTRQPQDPRFGRQPQDLAMLSNAASNRAMDNTSFEDRTVPIGSPTDQALASTVRLKVEDDEGHSFGTGTVIDVHGQEALVLTCGHIFRPSGGKGRILMDRYDSPTAEPTIGELISYDMDLDIGLVSMKLTRPIKVAQLAPLTYQAEANDPVFSVGCSRGTPPTIMHGKINQIDRYLGPPNITASGRPVDGRSGGGLFNAAGQLIGVCSAADPEIDEGLYGALPRVYYELDRNGLTFVYDQRASGEPIAEVATTSRDLQGLGPSRPTPFVGGGAGISKTSANGQELVCVLRGEHKDDSKVIVIKNPSPELIEQLSRAAATSE